MPKAAIVNGSIAYRQLFEHCLGYEIVDSLVSNLENIDLLVFTGGEDVSPGLYGAEVHPTTYNNVYRDQQEAQLFEKALLWNIPMVGICRGAQFLNVMSGGEMYQDVGGHTMDHSITDLTTGEVVLVSSTHHQMMKPSSKAVLVASSALGNYREWWDGQVFTREQSEQDYEVVFYPHTNCLCFQPHPEFFHSEYKGMRKYFGELIRRYLENNNGQYNPS